MNKIYLILCAVLCLFAPLSVGAQEVTSSVSVDKENISNLISTLESPEQRDQFIQNLKTLQDNYAAENDDDVVISDLLGLDQQVENLTKAYTEFLARHDLNNSITGKAALTVGSILFFWLVTFFIRKGSYKLRDFLVGIRSRFSLRHNRFWLYARCLRYCGHVIATVLFAYTVAVIWGMTDFEFLGTTFFLNIFEQFLNLLFVTLLAIVIWESVNGYMEYAIQNFSTNLSNRIRTILPIAHNVVFVAFAVLFTLVLLSELGVNILPLLAGAGIFGIAVGFGAQTMVKDFLSGFTIILEDLIQVGDVVKVGGKIGLIEKITLRKVQLRDLSGIVYTVPFSEISVVENWTKEFSYYVMDIGVAYREDPDEVIGYLREIDEELRADEDFKDLILEPLEIMGVDQFADSAVIIKARIKTKPIKQWEVGRAFNRRMKYKFDEKGIEIPFPHQTIYFGEDKNGKAPPANIIVKNSSEKKAEPKKKKQAKKKEDTDPVQNADQDEAA